MDYPIRTPQQLRPLLMGLRKKAGLSQAALAAQLGISQQSYARIEANPATTNFERLYTILRMLGGELLLATPDDPASATSPKRRRSDRLVAPAPAPLKPSNEESW